MKQSLTLTVIANIASNYSENVGNIGSIQKIFRQGKAYGIRSRESLKNSLMLQSGMYEGLKVVIDGAAQKNVGEDLNASNCRALESGYMNTKMAKVRKSSFYLTDAVSFFPIVGEPRFHNNLHLAQTYAKEKDVSPQEKGKDTGLMPYQYEFDRSLKKYSITIHLDQIGYDPNYEASCDKEEKIARVYALLDGIQRLSLTVRGNMDNAEPLFIIGGIGPVASHYFENIVQMEEESLILSEELIHRLFSGYRCGLLKGGIFGNEKEIEKKLSAIPVSLFFEKLKEDVKKYYEASSN